MELPVPVRDSIRGSVCDPKAGTIVDPLLPGEEGQARTGTPHPVATTFHACSRRGGMAGWRSASTSAAGIGLAYGCPGPDGTATA
jgi:hypothetical protein